MLRTCVLNVLIVFFLFTNFMIIYKSTFFLSTILLIEHSLTLKMCFFIKKKFVLEVRADEVINFLRSHSSTDRPNLEVPKTYNLI